MHKLIPNQLPVCTSQMPFQDSFLLQYLNNNTVLVNSIHLNILNHLTISHSEMLFSHLSKFQFHPLNYLRYFAVPLKILDQLISDTTLQILLHSFLFHTLFHNTIQSIFEPPHNLHFQLIDWLFESFKKLYHYLFNIKLERSTYIQSSEFLDKSYLLQIVSEVF